MEGGSCRGPLRAAVLAATTEVALLRAAAGAARREERRQARRRALGATDRQALLLRLVRDLDGRLDAALLLARRRGLAAGSAVELEADLAARTEAVLAAPGLAARAAALVALRPQPRTVRKAALLTAEAGLLHWLHRTNERGVAPAT